MESDAHGITRHDGLRLVEGLAFLLFYCLTIPAANWLIGHVGSECVPKGPCLIPVLPGVLAPSGVMMVGRRWCSATSCSGASAPASGPARS